RLLDRDPADPRSRGRRPRLKRGPCGLFLVGLTLGAAGCGGSEPEARVPIAEEQPEDEILRIAKAWRSTLDNKGFRTPPSPITMFSEQQTSTLTLTPGTSAAVESLVFD